MGCIKSSAKFEHDFVLSIGSIKVQAIFNINEYDIQF